MKKKVKLFTTIASLCLAVSLMAFGVYAATSITAKVSGSISFTSTEIAGYWEYSLQLTGGTFEGKSGAEQTALTYANDTKNQAYENEAPGIIVNTADDNDTATLTVTATFHNEADTVTANLTATNKKTETAGAVTITGGDATTATAKGEGTITFTVVFKANNLYTNAGGTYELNFNAARA